jgi:hypothetical protein
VLFTLFSKPCENEGLIARILMETRIKMDFFMTGSGVNC